MSLFEDLAVRMVSKGIQQELIFLGALADIPSGPGPYLSIMETGGTRPDRTHNSVATPAYPRPSAMIVARAATTVAAQALARAAYDAVSGIRNEVVGSTRYLEVDMMGEPSDALGPDASGRARWSFNVMARASA